MTRMRHTGLSTVFSVAAVLCSVVSLAAIPGTDVVIPVAARIQGLGVPPSQWYTTLWLSNQSASNITTVQIEFYQRDGAVNPVARANMSLAPGETQRIENCIERLFDLQNVAGSLRLRASEKVLASSRTYNLPPGGSEKDTTGQYFAGTPVSFAAGVNQPTHIQGVSQDDESRTNFGIVEVNGEAVTVHVTLKDAAGAVIAGKDYQLPAYGHMQKAVSEIGNAIKGNSNALLDLEITAGGGKVLAYCTQTANISQDGSGFEMAFPENWLTSLNSLKGDVTLKAGENVQIATGTNSQGLHSMGEHAGQTITVSAPGVVGPPGPQGLEGKSGPAGPTGATGSVGLTGPQGPTGAQGVPGAAGIPGVQGAIGPIGPNGPQGLNWQQEWVVTTTYAQNDAVSWLGSAYMSLMDANVGNQPETSPAQWSLLAQAGASGAQGPTGPVGPQGATGDQGSTGPQGPIGPTGLQGPTGAQGVPGPPGIPGAQGAIGPIGPTGPQGLTWQQEWVATTTYAQNDAVSWLGSAYMSLMDANVGNQPETSPAQWSLLAQAGASGAQGPTGPTGPQGATGDQGSTGPQGPIGPTGPQGPIGPQGLPGEIPTGVIVMWSGSLASIPAGWVLCDGSNGTPNLRDRFIVGASAGVDPGVIGGANTVTLTTNELPAHNHAITVDNAGSHTHTGVADSTGLFLKTEYVQFYYQTLLFFFTYTPTTNQGFHDHTLTINAAGDHSHSASAGSTGSGASFDIRPSYYSLAFIMKL